MSSKQFFNSIPMKIKPKTHFVLADKISEKSSFKVTDDSFHKFLSWTLCNGLEF